MNQKGFSLLEILIGLALISLIGTFTVGKIMDQRKEGRISAAKVHLSNLVNNLKNFYRHCNRYPDSLEDLVSKPEGLECKRYAPEGYLDKVPMDPWDMDFVYEPSSNRRKFTLKSLGADSEEGGEGYDEDISSEDL